MPSRTSSRKLLLTFLLIGGAQAAELTEFQAYEKAVESSLKIFGDLYSHEEHHGIIDSYLQKDVQPSQKIKNMDHHIIINRLIVFKPLSSGTNFKDHFDRKIGLEVDLIEEYTNKVKANWLGQHNPETENMARKRLEDLGKILKSKKEEEVRNRSDEEKVRAQQKTYVPPYNQTQKITWMKNMIAKVETLKKEFENVFKVLPSNANKVKKEFENVCDKISFRDMLVYALFTLASPACIGYLISFLPFWISEVLSGLLLAVVYCLCGLCVTVICLEKCAGKSTLQVMMQKVCLKYAPKK